MKLNEHWNTTSTSSIKIVQFFCDNSSISFVRLCSELFLRNETKKFAAKILAGSEAEPSHTFTGEFKPREVMLPLALNRARFRLHKSQLENRKIGYWFIVNFKFVLDKKCLIFCGKRYFNSSSKNLKQLDWISKKLQCVFRNRKRQGTQAKFLKIYN